MPYLRNKVSGSVTDNLDPDSKEYQTLIHMTIAAGQTELGGGQPVPSGGVQPLWEEISQEDVGDDPVGGHVLVIAIPGEVAGTDETMSDPVNAEYAGTVTAIQYVPAKAVAGVITNNRTVGAQQTVITGTASPARAVTVLGSKAVDNTVSLAAYQPLAITVTSAPLPAGAQVQAFSNHNGTGAVEPGGVVIVTYTRA